MALSTSCEQLWCSETTEVSFPFCTTIHWNPWAQKKNHFGPSRLPSHWPVATATTLDLHYCTAIATNRWKYRNNKLMCNLQCHTSLQQGMIEMIFLAYRLMPFCKLSGQIPKSRNDQTLSNLFTATLVIPRVGRTFPTFADFWLWQYHLYVLALLSHFTNNLSFLSVCVKERESVCLHSIHSHSSDVRMISS